MRNTKFNSDRKGWRECEREFRATRDREMKVSLPKLRFMEKVEDELERGDAAA